MNTLIPIIEYSNMILFGSDDIMKPNMVETLLDISDNYDIIQYKFDTFIDDNKNNVLKRESSHMFAIGCIFIKKGVFDLAGGFNQSRFSSDFELLTRVDKFVKKYKLNKSLFLYRKHNKSLTKTVPLSERAIFDNIIRVTKYNETNVKIKTENNIIDKIY
jgi:hypothetical protein